MHVSGSRLQRKVILGVEERILRREWLCAKVGALIHTKTFVQGNYASHLDLVNPCLAVRSGREPLPGCRPRSFSTYRLNRGLSLHRER